MNNVTNLAEAKRKPSTRPRARPQTRRTKKVGVVSQIKTAFSKGSLIATMAGFVFGGAVPAGSFVICHQELIHAHGWRVWALSTLIAGGLLFSAKTVYQWCQAAYQDRAKALGFVVLAEGIMVLSEVETLAYSALALLVVINGIATGVTLSQGK